MSAHTPGPWHVERADSDGANVVAIAQVAWCGTNGSYGRDASQTISAKEAKANAQLIAAAPDLLEALETSLEEMKDDWITLDGEFGPFMQEFGDIENAIKEQHASTKTIRMAIAAIAKAKGEV